MKKKIVYEEEIYSPDAFRVGERAMFIFMRGSGMIGVMPTMLIGWTKGECHLAFHYQSLQ